MLNRTRLSSLDAFGLRDQRNRIYPALEASDGSTLSLDFTQMSSLDSRFTFSRSSTATFINSSGFVKVADHNLVPNSAFVGSGIGTGWVQNGGGTFTNSGTGSITTAVTTSNQAYVSRTFVTKQGIQYSASVNVTSITGTLNYNQVFAVAGSISADVFYRNGSVVNASTTAQTGLLTIIFTAGAGGTNTFRAGVGASGTNQTDVIVVFDSPRAIEGEITQPTYFVSPSGSEYQAPRFDYNPTTLTPTGLLIEGSASNLTALSESFAVSGGSNNWNPSGLNGSAVTATTQTNPAGLASSIRLVEDTANTAHTLFTAVSVTSGSQYTFSVFVRGDGTRTLAGLRMTLSGAATDYSVIFDLADGTTGTAYTAGTPGTVTPRAVQYPNGWWRISITMNAPAASTLFYIYNATTKNATNSLPAYTGTNNGIYVWGAQLEAGSGASSYIPTGASQVTRAEDSCVMNDITSLQYSNTNGSMYYEGQFSKLNTASYPWRMGFTTETGDHRVFGFLTNSGGSGIEAKGPSSTPTASVNVSIALNTNYKLAWSMDTALATGELRRSSNGGAVSVSSATALTVTGTPTYFMFGQKGYGAFFPAGTIKAAKYWPTTLSDAQLQAITTT